MRWPNMISPSGVCTLNNTKSKLGPEEARLEVIVFFIALNINYVTFLMD
jgi:hypothetical protein